MIELQKCWKLKGEIENVEEKMKCIEDSLKRMTATNDGLPKKQVADDNIES